MKNLLFGILVLVLTLPTSAQKHEKFLKIKGNVLKRYDQSKFKKPVNIYALSSCGDTTFIETSNSRYKFYLRPGCNYEIHYNASDYVDKFYFIKAREVPKNVRSERFSLDVDIMMVRKVKGLDTSIFQKPQAKAFYHPTLKKFVWNPDYTKRAMLKADSTLMNIGSIDKDKQEPKQNQQKPKKKEDSFEPSYLYALQKNIPMDKVLPMEVGKWKEKTPNFDLIHAGKLWTQMSLYFLKKDSVQLLILCEQYHRLTDQSKECDFDHTMKSLDHPPKNIDNPLFFAGIILEKLYWLTHKGRFLRSDYDDLIRELQTKLKEVPQNKETDAVLSFKADCKQLISNYPNIKEQLSEAELEKRVTTLQEKIKAIHEKI